MQEEFSTENQVAEDQITTHCEGEKLGVWEMLWGTIRYPDRTFEQTKGRASLVWPILLLFGTVMLSVVFMGILQSEEMTSELQKGIAQNPGVTPEMMGKIIGFATSPVILMFGAIGAVIIMLVTWLIKSGVLHLFTKALGGTGVFRQAFGIVAWSSLPVSLGCIVKIPYSLVVGRSSFLQGQGLLSIIIKSLDPFLIWSLVLLAIGFSVVYGVKKSKAAVPVVGIWLIGVLIESAGLLLQ